MRRKRLLGLAIPWHVKRKAGRQPAIAATPRQSELHALKKYSLVISSAIRQLDSESDGHRRNQFFKKGKHKYENQDWHQSWPPRPADYPWLKNNGPKGAGSGQPAAHSQRKEKAIMKIKTNVKAGAGNGAINVGGGS
jgi:hypothetical protein